MRAVRSGAAAIAVATVAAFGGAARAEPAAVPLLVVDAPPEFDGARFASALETYVPNARVLVSARGAGDPAVICADAVAAARAAASPMALWVRWVDGAMVIERVGEAGCGAVESSSVDVAPDQAAFVYRVAALKVASLVREVPAGAGAGAGAGVVDADVGEVPKVEARPSPPPPRLLVPALRPRRTLEVGVSGIVGTSAAERVAMAGVGGWFGTRWRFGGSALVSAAVDDDAPGGDGRARVFGGFVGVRRELAAWGRGGPALDGGARWRFEVGGELGLIHVRAAATRAGTTMELREQVWTPVVAITPRVRLSVAGPLGLVGGPSLEAAARSVRLTLGETPLYDARRLRLRFDLGAELRF